MSDYKKELKSLGNAYSSMYEAKITISPGGKMGRDDKDWDEQKGPDISGEHAGAMDNRTPKQKAKQSKENKELASKAKAKDPAAKQQAQKEEGRQKAKDAAAKVGIDKILKDPDKKAKEDKIAADKRRAKLKKRFGGPGINQGMREEVQSLGDAYSSMYEAKKESKKDSDPCWTGYKRKPGTKKFDDGSCVKEEEEYSVSVEDGIALEEGKKECKDGYYYCKDEKKCKKKKKKKSSKTSIIVGRGYGGHYHDHDDDKEDGNEGGGDTGGGDGGGGGE